MENLTIKCVNPIKVKLTQIGLFDEPITLQYRIGKDGVLQDFNLNTYVNIDAGQLIELVGTNNSTFSKDMDNYYHFEIAPLQENTNGYVIVSGNLNSLTMLAYENLEAPCFARLFESNKELIDASKLEIPFNIASERCYSRMFFGCYNLFSSPSSLPATTLAKNCYHSMFEECTNLETAPLLPAQTLAYSCYQEMFEKCTKLVNAPDLPATKLVSGCYREMFYGCTSLKNLTVNFKSWSSYNATDIWLAGTAKNGTFTKPDVLEEKNGNSFIPNNWTVINEETEKQEEPQEPSIVPGSGVLIAGDGLFIDSDGVISLTANIPSRTSQLINDSGFISEFNFPTYTGENGISVDQNRVISLTANFLTEENLNQLSTFIETNYALKTDIPTSNSSLTNDAGYITGIENNALLSDIKTKTSELENDAKFITSSAIPNKVGVFINDVGYLTSIPEEYALKTEIPTIISTYLNTSTQINEVINQTISSDNTVNNTISSLISSYIDNSTQIIEVINNSLNNNDDSGTININTTISSLISGYLQNSTQVNEVVNNILSSNNSESVNNIINEYLTENNYAQIDNIPTTVTELTDANNYVLTSAITQFVTSTQVSHIVESYGFVTKNTTYSADGISLLLDPEKDNQFSVNNSWLTGAVSSYLDNSTQINTVVNKALASDTEIVNTVSGMINEYLEENADGITYNAGSGLKLEDRVFTLTATVADLSDSDNYVTTGMFKELSSLLELGEI